MAIQNAKTRGEIRRILGRSFLGPQFVTGSATGGSTTTIVDSALNGIYSADFFNNRPIRNSTQNFNTYISDYAAAGTFTIPTNTATSAADVYEVWHRGAATVEDANDAIDLAIQSVVNKLLTDKMDESLVYQKKRTLYAVPSGYTRLSRVSVDMNPTHYVNNPTEHWDTITNLRDVTGNTKLAQSFKLRSGSSNPGMQMGDLYLYLAKVGSPTGNLSVTIESDSSGSPSGTALATSANVDVSGLTTEVLGIRFTFTAKPVLALDTTYWIVLAGTHTVSTSNYAVWANDSDASYNDGSAVKYSGSAWSAVTGDLIFNLRSPQPRYIDLERGKHWRAFGGSTPYVEITDAGEQALYAYDGRPLRLFGQAAPSLPSSDSTSVDVPYDYVVAHAGLELHNRNAGFIGNRPNASAIIAAWLQKKEETSKSHSTLPYPGTYKVRDL